MRFHHPRARRIDGDLVELIDFSRSDLSIGAARERQALQAIRAPIHQYRRRLWYSAYPQFTTAEIRTNAEIRRGLSGSMTEDEAMRWLALFGSAPRPPDKLLSSEIQSLVFGGLGFMPCGTCLLFDLPEDVAVARKWLADILPDIAFNDGRRHLAQRAVVTLAFGARGLRRLGLPEEGIATFRSPSRKA